jgi:methyl-accepting chemotaxis protein
MSQPTYNRRRILVDHAFQWSLCFHGISIGIILLVSIGIGLFAPLLWDLEVRGPNKPIDVDLAIVMVYMHERFWVVAGACLLLVGLASLRLSHRIAGPMVRYRRHLKLLANGKLPPILRTRRNDFMKKEVACLNDAIEGLRSRIDRIRSAASSLQLSLQEAEKAEDSGVLVSMRPLTAAAIDLQQQLQGIVDASPEDEALLVAEERMQGAAGLQAIHPQLIAKSS